LLQQQLKAVERRGEVDEVDSEGSSKDGQNKDDEDNDDKNEDKEIEDAKELFKGFSN
jgi:hypothetical protein